MILLVFLNILITIIGLLGFPFSIMLCWRIWGDRYMRIDKPQTRWMSASERMSSSFFDFLQIMIIHMLCGVVGGLLWVWFVFGVENHIVAILI